jgi:hypothetical protein
VEYEITGYYSSGPSTFSFWCEETKTKYYIVKQYGEYFLEYDLKRHNGTKRVQIYPEYLAIRFKDMDDSKAILSIGFKDEEQDEKEKYELVNKFFKEGEVNVKA